MKKKSLDVFRFLLSVFLMAFFIFNLQPSQSFSLSLKLKSDTLTRLKQGVAANHKVQFRAASTINSGNIVIYFGEVVADKKNVIASDVHLLYGAHGLEAEYLVQADPGNGIWGAAFSLNGTSTVLTMSYPTSNGVPVNVGNNVIIGIGTDPKVDTPPVAINQAQQNNNQNNQIFAKEQQQQPEPVIELVPSEQAKDISQDQKNQLLNSLSGIQKYINEQLAKLRNLTERRSVETHPESAPAIVGSAPSQQQEAVSSSESNKKQGSDKKLEAPLWSWGGVSPSDSDLQNNDRKYLITLANPITAILDTLRENTVALERPDGGRLDIFVPTAVLSGTNNISLVVKPLTLEQSKEWSKLRLEGTKRPMLAQVFVVTALDDLAQPVLQLEKPIKYNFHFTQKEIEEEGIDPHTLEVYSWDAEDEVLQREPSTIDLESNVVSASIYHLTTFLLLGETQKTAGIQKGTSGIAVIPSVVLPRIASDIKSEGFGLANTATSETITFAGSDFYTTPNTRLSFCIQKKIFPKPVKNITLLVDAFPNHFIFNQDKGCYSAIMVTPIVQSKKTVTIKIVYADDQVQIMKYRLNVIASELQLKVLSVVAPRVQEARVAVHAVNKQVEQAVVTTQPVLQTTAIATGAGVTALNPTIISNSLNWYHYFNHFLSAMLSALGLRKRRRPWGLVYNAITKMPIDLAIVRLFSASNSKLIETQVSDKEGRFSFIASPGEYMITITKPPFIFPSKIVQGDKDGEYAGVYHDAKIRITNVSETMNLSIPLDPPNPKDERLKKSFLDVVKNLARNYSGASLALSLVVSIVLALYAPSVLNSALLLVNSLFVISQSLLSTRKEKEWGTVFDTLSFEPVPLAAISMINAKEGKLLRTRLSDYVGRFSFLSPPGEYALVVMKEGYAFPPARVSKSKKYKEVYLGGKFIVKKKKALVKTNIPLEKRIIRNS
ncbi:carboxypeptidase regulatory-like domain-containing protein [Candidatus Uhrbacteria bacterium]|nr:carboxypeptidase regulatory-like domain-containing protein [Candidatus Uhrbacteria bacterium]